MLWAVIFLSQTARAQSLDAQPLDAQSLEAQLKREPLRELAVLAESEGDAARGAIVFHQATLACAKCHAVDDIVPGDQRLLGPRLSERNSQLTDEAIIEALLDPSKTIRAGYETANVLTHDGRTLTGLIVERTETHVTLRDASGMSSTIPSHEVERFALQRQSLMPSGQIDQLTSRQQFFDLVRYLSTIRDGGPARAEQLQPSPALLSFKLPDYESDVDHAGLIKSWNATSFERGKAIYGRVCANCHGTHEQLGSLPTSLRFAEGKFKNGSDPFAMYQTLTRGFGFMPAQSWMVPIQKYDVIHYIREAYLRPFNQSQLTTIDERYLAGVPRGSSRGPAPNQIQPWSAMDYGPSLTHCYEAPSESLNIAYKGVAVRVDEGAGGIARGDQWMVFDTDTMRLAVAWHTKPNESNGRFIDWRDIQMNGEHAVHPKIVGESTFANSCGPGWANPRTGSFDDDQRTLGRDGRRYGPLPRDWAQYHGLYHHGSKVIFSYTVGGAAVLESPGCLSYMPADLPTTYLRTLNIAPHDRQLRLQVADQQRGSITDRFANQQANAVSTSQLSAGIVYSAESAKWSLEQGRLILELAPSVVPVRLTLWLCAQSDPQPQTSLAQRAQQISAQVRPFDMDLSALISGGPRRWAQTLASRIVTTSADGPFAVDHLVAPESNPWLAQTRFTGLDFFRDGRIAVCTWDGDVWIVEIDEPQQTTKWQRIASGMFQPLGLKVLDEKIHVTCRDQLTVLHDLNADGETDFYQALNNDHQVTEHFHEFAMGLQVDEKGNFYYAKSGRHALPAVVPHHGTLLKVSRDGAQTTILATGFRAANGVCLNPDGSFLVTDQEGFWNPKNRINWVTLDPSGKPKFYGNMFGYHDVTDTSDAAMEPPLCWITNKFDRSPGELLWVDSPRWRELEHSLINLSYGTGKVFSVLHEKVAGVHQGGMIELPIPAFQTGVMRGRFRPHDQHLYLCGMFAWAGDAIVPGGLYRIRTTGRPIVLPTALHAREGNLELVFSQPLKAQSVSAEHVQVKTWSLERSEKYGSKHFNERGLAVQSATLADDGRTVRLHIAELEPCWCMEIKFDFLANTGDAARGVIHNTIHRLAR